ncbi:calcium-dependent protein kinase 16 [Artemisia annua]|uniref:Calcium-dependent protein kinase 16 n=1 Tax=Artemisia annua TaxID=35608 RepID=A0A2U1M956_ARTAN|nr:calcium-dependent protein kinase 16 [Artemisia annua]
MLCNKGGLRSVLEDWRFLILAVKDEIILVVVEDVKREVKILEALSGPENVVQFYNAYEDSSYVFIVMELCEGGYLLDHVEADEALLLRLSLPFLLKIIYLRISNYLYIVLKCRRTTIADTKNIKLKDPIA